ncbi:MAG: methylenetetrahydrofolate--tRNA-(uracil(54)-C(5))-methyltransferase (FADH(2)-oxidizing) TrmFO, partial [Anaerolineales bacterium]
MDRLNVIGGGLAGSEAAWQAAERGVRVRLYEMRPAVMTGAHVTSDLAELVCSNSLGSDLYDRASGVLKNELRKMNSLLIRCAEKTSVPAGGALAVSREDFAKRVTDAIDAHPRIDIIRQEVVSIPTDPTILASGPLTSERLSNALLNLTGQDHLYFFDAIAPIVTRESIDMDRAYFGSRYDRGELEDGDYINCPLSEDEYHRLVDALLTAERIDLKSYEVILESGVRAGAHKFFEGCLPVEVLASRGRESLAFGPMRPIGLSNPHTGRRPYAV